MSPLIPGGNRIAYFGGSFDPPHNGHLAVARAAREALSLDRVLFAPVGLQPLKPEGSSASYEDRVTMTRLAIAGEPGFEISLADAPTVSHEPNYTVATLARLREMLGVDGRLFLILGADAFRTLSHWYRGAEVPFAADLIVVSRPGENLADLAAVIPHGLAIEPRQHSKEFSEYRLKNSAGGLAWLYLLPDLHYDISATDVREQLRASRAGRRIFLMPS